MFTASVVAAVMLAAGAPAPQADRAAERPARSIQADSLASDILANGNAATAIATLERSVEADPNDPALLINLGIAHAQVGEAETAHSMFERALLSSEPLELEIAEGTSTDSRRLARRAMRMLERGEFTAAFSRRD